MACVKCKQHHKPPVGVSCTRMKAVNALGHIELGTVNATAGISSNNDSAEKGSDGSPTSKSKQDSPVRRSRLIPKVVKVFMIR